MTGDTEMKRQCPIAIVGMDCLFPNASGLHDYWRLIRHGEDSVTEVPETHWKISDYCANDPQLADMITCRRGAFLSETVFDPIEFGIPPTVIEATDTAQLLGLVVAKRALADAGYDDQREFDRRRAGVILGVTGTQELVLPLGARLGHPLWRKALAEAGVATGVAEEVVRRIADGYVEWQENSFPGLLGNVVAGRIANRLDLRGTNCVVDAACASSLSAVHLAALELSSGRTDLVLTGGVDTLNDIFMFMCFHKAQALSPTGDARPFSQDADGTVLGEGVGMLVLKRLEDAERAGDRIYAVLRGIGTSSDGRSQSIYAPLAVGQARALRAAYEVSGVAPVTIELVEAHGTGTRVGDVVEFDALTTVYREAEPDGKWCALGSVKSQIGHTKAAAGAASLIKTVLALHQRVLPPTIKVGQPNPKLALDDSPFYLSTETRPWFSDHEHPRRAGVSAFGFGGSNFHAVLEEYPETRHEVAWDGSVEIVALSAPDPKHLETRLAEWGTAVAKGLARNELANRAARSREMFSAKDAYRLVLVVEHQADLAKLVTAARTALRQKGTDEPWQLPNVFFGGPSESGKLAFLFPGQGSQYVGMGRDVVCQFPEAFDAVTEADQADDEPLAQQIYPQPTFSDEVRTAQGEQLKRTEITQPALGAVSLALLRVLKRFGVEPDLAAGHSFGELVALRAAGRIGDEALRTLARLRGRLMGESKGERGAMLAVEAPLEDIDELLEAESDDVVLANRNTPTQGIISGVCKAVERVGRACEQRGWRTRMLQVSAAFHTRFMAPAQERFRAALEEITFELGRIPVLANVTAGLYPDDAGGARDLLARQLTSPVNFVDQIRHLYDAGARTFIEVGPKNVLTGLVRRILRGKPLHALALDTGLGRGSGMMDLARGLALLTVLGYSVDLQAWERPAPEIVQPKMPVPLLGANYRSPAKTSPESHRPTVLATPQKLGSGSMKNAENGGRPESAAATPTWPASTDQLAQAFQVVQEGLRSMQALQQQTAAAHERFLQTQEQAHKTFQMLVAQQQHLMANALGLSEALPTPTPMPVSAPVSPSPAPPVAMPSGSRGDGDARAAPASESPATIPDVAGGSQDSRASGGEFGQIVLEAVSELTGYPIEMLDLDMDMEADLGIDSIKRLEILGAVQRRIPEMAEVNSQYMGSLRTLRNIIEYARGAGEEAAISSDPTRVPAQPTAVPEPVPEKSPAAKLERRVLTSVELAPATQRPLRIARGHEVWVTDDGTPLAPTIVKRLDALGHAARLIGPRAGWRNVSERKVGGLILLAAPKDGDAAEWDEHTEEELKAAFKRVRMLGSSLRAAAKEGGALLATVSRLDGAFGLRGGSFDPLQGGLSGLAKTAVQEWPEVQCRALDVACTWHDHDAVADAILCECGMREQNRDREGAAEWGTGNVVEVGLDRGRRVGLELVTTPTTPGSLPLEDGDVVVISGGARGVTAETALALTRAKRPVLVLLGRSPEPTPEPDWLVGHDREAEVKRVLLAKAFDGSKPTPVELETEYRRRMANREVARNLERLRAGGATVVYCSVDVRDRAAVATLLDQIRREHGPVRGLIHAAGVLADHRIEDKTPEQFAGVFDTKVRGLYSLLEALRDDDLKFMVFFSSVSARFGRAGQVDYAMANEVLNKVAHRQAALRPDCRVVSINWGPWDGGMVTPSLRAEFARQGIGLIPLEAGAQLLVDELCEPTRGAVEVVLRNAECVMRKVECGERHVAAQNGRVSVAFERVLDVDSHPFMRSHVLDGHPVLPMAMMLEWLGHGALHNNPGLHLHGLEDFRVLKGVILNDHAMTVRVVAARARRSGETFEVEVELRSGADDAEVKHARAKAILATRLPKSPTFELPAHLHQRPYALDVEEVYRDILFHGPHFQALKNVAGISRHGIVADVRSAPAPAEWMSQPLRSSWLGDPLAVDAGLQLGVLWCHEELGALALPSYQARYRQYQPFPKQGVRTVLEVDETQQHRLTGSITFLDANGRVVARSEGCEWTVDPSLRKAFAHNELVGV